MNLRGYDLKRSKAFIGFHKLTDFSHFKSRKNIS